MILPFYCYIIGAVLVLIILILAMGYTKASPDVDGTYGINNPGYRFFLANGTAVECSGTMVSCVYSDAPLSLSAVEIKSVKNK